MSMIDWAKNEVGIACKREIENCTGDGADYGCGCYKSALKAYQGLCEDGHSGLSISITQGILNRLISGKPLTPIEDTEDMWNICNSGESDDSILIYQCKRMYSLFKYLYPDGKVKYSDVDRCCCVNKDDSNISWNNSFIRSIYDEMFHITMPYMPSNRTDIIICDELLTDRKNGDFDTISILYIKRANGQKVDVNRYFKESGKSFEEISETEWYGRFQLHAMREEMEHGTRT